VTEDTYARGPAASRAAVSGTRKSPILPAQQASRARLATPRDLARPRVEREHAGRLDTEEGTKDGTEEIDNDSR
jgi:hypothetical protein